VCENITPASSVILRNVFISESVASGHFKIFKELRDADIIAFIRNFVTLVYILLF